MIKIKYSFMLSFFLLLSISADEALFSAYENFFTLPNEQGARVINYTFYGQEKEVSGTLRWSQKSEERFSLSFSMGLLKLIVTRNNQRLQLYIPHNKTLFISPVGDGGFSVASLMSTLQEMDQRVYGNLLKFNGLRFFVILYICQCK